MRLALALLCLAAPLAAAAAQPSVRPARVAVLSAPLRDDDLAWIAPLLAIQGGDLQRTSGQLNAAAAAIASHGANDAGAARVARIRAGTLHALDELRGYSEHAVVPPQARYDAACSGELTGLTSGQWEAVWAAITTARSDEMLIDQPGVLERDAGSAEAAARRRANVAWYRRNRAAVDAATRSAAP